MNRGGVSRGGGGDVAPETSPIAHVLLAFVEEVGVELGNKWAVHAAGGGIGRSNSPSCVDLMWLEYAKKIKRCLGLVFLLAECWCTVY
jgi:hypothetical protein